jgi:hypothetical protein
MRKSLLFILICVFSNITFSQTTTGPDQKRQTSVSISGEKFIINGIPTFRGKIWRGYTLEGLLPNSRMVQGIFDDLNQKTSHLWSYPDSKTWDADRNTNEFVMQMSNWHKKGLLAFTINLQGGSPQGYSKNQPWENSAIDASGNLRSDYMNRLERILDQSDKLGMVTILGLFYFGQDERIKDEAAVKLAVINVLKWLSERRYTNVLIEINNECNVKYNHPILQPERIHELIEMAKRFTGNGIRYLVSTSYGGGTIPSPSVVKSADFILLHGNGVKDPIRIIEMVNNTRKVEGYTPKPVVFNEDDHFDFEKPSNNLTAATSVYASWGYFDYRMKDEGFAEGYQSVPVDWSINSVRKKGFFQLLERIFVNSKIQGL